MVMESKPKIDFSATFEYKLIYIFRINDHDHAGFLKIGDATLHAGNRSPLSFADNCHDLRFAAKQRIDEYTSTAGIAYELLYAEIAIYVDELKSSKHYGETRAFRDHDVHKVLLRSGIERKLFDTNKKQNEWFKVDLQTAIKAIKAVKSCQESLDPSQIFKGRDPIIFRPEQNDAILKTIKHFKTNNRMLWNAKMRFGKTLCALEVAKKEKFKKTIIITHRPVVSDSWFDDFNKIFYDSPEYSFGSKTKGSSLASLEKSGKSYIYFASIQDLRGAETVGGNFDKNTDIYSTDWDFVIVDEAHEGTKTDLGQSVIKEIVKPSGASTTKTLELSGTPFNLLTDFEKDDIFTWDYIMEQEAKVNWPLEHFGDSNPYEDLPRLNIFTYHLEKELVGYMDIDDKAFNFKEFFRTWDGDKTKDGANIPVGVCIGDFVHEADIKSFLNLICKENSDTNYPFSTKEYQDFFRHTLWMLPGVKEAKAFCKLLREHPVFGQFSIVNVAGPGDEEIDSATALTSVRKAITKKPENTRTITVSCDRLTTGVTVPEWTAVIMLAGSYSTAASRYLQTIFRVQTPANINGRTKENCYVFDFAPDRTLKMIAESVQLSAQASVNPSSEIQLGKFLNFCPVISIDHTGMKEFKVSYLLQELKKAYAERVARNGFDDPKLYNDELLKLDDIQLQDFENLKKIVGTSKQTKSSGDIDINHEDFSDEELEKIRQIEKKPKKELTEEEKEALKELKEKRKNKDTAISILRAISIRIPLMVYGIDKEINVDITVDNFADPSFIDDLSWNEFMPPKVTREIFKKFSKYYEKTVFVAACRRIRSISKNADELEPTERTRRIAELFSTFKNPDKETVLTPWRVVNMHMSDTIGGFDFFDESHTSCDGEPRFVNQPVVSDSVFGENSTILEINSKSGLYPLYVAYTIYRKCCDGFLKTSQEDDLSFEKKQEIWDRVVSRQIFVVCKTPMAKLITKRTLIGYRDARVNTKYYEDLTNQFKQSNKLENFIRKMKQGNSFWKAKEDDNMRFSAVVGNPPYQELVANNGKSVSQANPIYNLFVRAAIKLKPDYISMITPSLWMTGGTGLDDFRKEMLTENHISKLFDYESSEPIFPTVAIAGGISYFLYDQKVTGHTEDHYFRKNGTSLVCDVNMAEIGTDIFIRDQPSSGILQKVGVFSKGFVSFDTLVSTYSPFANGIVGNYKNDFKDTEFPGSIKIYRYERGTSKRYAYIDRKKIIANQDWIDRHKVFVSKAGEVSAKFNGLPFYGEPGSACNETYLVVGPFESKIECDNAIKYMNTSIYKFFIAQIKKTQNAARGVYRYVPIQDFSKTSDIDWSQSLDVISKSLYKKYGISDDEVVFIESIVQ